MSIPPINQYNIEGSNNLTINNYDPPIFCSYENELCSVVEIGFFDGPSENLIRDGKLYIDEYYTEKIKKYLDVNKFCLIKAPEGRGKTYLSKIIAYDYYHNGNVDVFFLDLKDYKKLIVSTIKDKLIKWHKEERSILLVIENLHAYEKIEELLDLIRTWVGSKDNRFRFLFNTRPTNLDIEDFSNWDGIVDLVPDKYAVHSIIDIFSKETGRVPFSNSDNRENFINKFFPTKKINNGANLRLLKIYLRTWQNNPEIKYISDISEDTIIKEFRKIYLSDLNKLEIETLWYISSLYQFDVALPDDFVQQTDKLLNEGLLRFEENRFHLPHSVDAYFLYKSICNYRHKNYVEKMKSFAVRFVNSILESDFPKDYQSDFLLLINGLKERRTEYNEIIFTLTEDFAKDIITKINDGFVLTFFDLKNHKDSDYHSLYNYFSSNKNWLIPIFRELSYGPLIFSYKNFKNNFKFNIFKEIFINTNDLEKCINAKEGNYKLLSDRVFCNYIVNSGDEFKFWLFEKYKQKKALLKQFLLQKSMTNICFVYIFYNKQFKYNIFNDFFESKNELEDYLNLNENYKALANRVFIRYIASLGDTFKNTIPVLYEKNKTLLNLLLVKSSITSLLFLYKAYKKHYNYNIFDSIFIISEKELKDYLLSEDNYKILTSKDFIKAININFKNILLECYQKKKDVLIPLLIKLSPLGLTSIFNAYKEKLNYNILKDIFINHNILDDYLLKNKTKPFTRDYVLKTISKLSYRHKQVINKYSNYNFFLYNPKPVKNSYFIKQDIIFKYWNNKLVFDINLYKDKQIYFKGVSWSYIERFVCVIRKNMSTENHFESLRITKDIVKLVLSKETLSYASSSDLAYFFNNIFYIDESFFRELSENEIIRNEVENRLMSPLYSVGDIHLFNQFFFQSWCKDKLIDRIINASDDQKDEITKWYADMTNKLRKNKEEIKADTLLEFVHQNLFLV